MCQVDIPTGRAKPRAKIYAVAGVPGVVVLLMLAFVVNCGSTADAQPTEIRSATETPELSDADLRATFPTLAEVRDTLGLDLTEHDQQPELGQAFEGTDTEQRIAGYRNTYRGNADEGGASIQLALYETVGAATGVATFIRTTNLEHASGGEPLDLGGIGDERFGYIFPPSENNEFVTTAALLRTGRVVVFITVLSHVDDGLGVQTHGLASTLIARLEKRMVTTGLPDRVDVTFISHDERTSTVR